MSERVVASPSHEIEAVALVQPRQPETATTDSISIAASGRTSLTTLDWQVARP